MNTLGIVVSMVALSVSVQQNAEVRSDANVLILVKEFSMDNTEVEGMSGKKADKVIAEKKPRLTSVLSQKLRMRLLNNGFAASPYSPNANSGTTEMLILDGEFVRIHKDKPRMTVRVWVYRPDEPEKRLIESDVSAVSTAGPIAIGSVAMNNLAHNVVRWLAVTLPPVIDAVKDAAPDGDPSP